jgi:predicted RNA-binding Zn ribbon-like protein
MPTQPSHLPADSVEPSPSHVGGHPALDLLNSFLAPLDTSADLLRNPELLRAWFATSGVVPSALAAQMAGFTSEELQRTAVEVRALREWFRELVLRWAAVGPDGARGIDLEHLNALLSKGRLQQTVSHGVEGFVLQTSRAIDGPSAVLAEAAASCVNLLVTHRNEEVRKCENPACSLWFVDIKRGPRRRWCSMAVCGNRMKVAALRARQRSRAGDEDASL